MTVFHIHIQGIVQGVGFRPFVYKLAISQGLNGWVNNTNDGVHIEINANKATAESFLQEILDKLPPLAVVTSATIKPVGDKDFKGFEIIQSEGKQKPNLLLTPDVAMCEDCRRELHNPKDRRYRYPFITCTNCGPRYSIITALPYDRPNTTMDKFKMCPVCWDEYNNPLERRHFSQTNSCPDCAVELQLYENGKITENFTDLDYIVRQWNKGKIIAIKGIGGYLLTCDATNKKAVQTLRERKHRPVKPFALMYPDLESIRQDAHLSKKEEKELKSIHSPIVLLALKKHLENQLALNEINSGLTRIGVMIPYTPLYDLLLSTFGKPIIATSGNITGSTIIYDDKKAIDELSEIADIILMNNRDIVIPQDDGVVQFSKESQQKIVLRRSRGKAPVYINPNLKFDKDVLATGSMLKSVFGFSSNGNVYISQFLGNTETYDAQVNYEKTFEHLINILKPEFKAVVTDKHPDYFATRFGKEFARKNNIPVYEIQHHKAHFYSVLGENDLLQSNEKILGIVWDGTGLGDDGNIWGGEFFLYENKQIKRIAHLPEFDFILADKMVKEPRISALAIFHSYKELSEIIKPKFSKTEWNIYQKLLQNPPLKSTSMGRLFDAVSSLLFDNDLHHFEAEASMRLEQKAAELYYKNNFDLSLSYLKYSSRDNFLYKLIKGIISDINNGLDRKLIAVKFHLTLVDYIRQTAGKLQIKHLAFSGGVFQNALLVDMIIQHLKEKYFLYFHKEFSPNDEGIAFGQMVFLNE